MTYPSQYYERWAGEFWEVLLALEGENDGVEIKRDTLALVAALFVVTNARTYTPEVRVTLP
jgi:hypothetical protein